MESMYGIGVTNRYALFLSEEDPLEKLKAKEKAKEEKKKKQAGVEKENKGVKTPPVKKPVAKVTNGIKDNQNVKPETQPKEDAAAKPKKVEKVKFNDEKKPQPDSPKDNETDNSG
ncbi:histone H1-III-like [Diaphorina citri]|uniref:Histone H1-III-like n=1 Tax=Diaphorina citri TaxID=121845 RepID=A0A3Q0IXJ2_DIACI|nr:histone H1-III-like [Diaphorina citri]